MSSLTILSQNLLYENISVSHTDYGPETTLVIPVVELLEKVRVVTLET